MMLHVRYYSYFFFSQQHTTISPPHPAKGVEDDGCHSLLDYDATAESARVLECIARSLNAVVVERKIIQNEVCYDDDGSILKNDKDVLIVDEPSVFGFGRRDNYSSKDNDDEADLSDDTPEVSDPTQQLVKKDGVFTRAEIHIVRVETHLLDPSPVSLTALAGSKSENAKILETPTFNGKNGNGVPENGNNGSQSAANTEAINIQETLSARNIRVAVVGNVDAGRIGLSFRFVSFGISSLSQRLGLPCFVVHWLKQNCANRQIDIDWYVDNVELGRWSRQKPDFHHEAPPRN